jgi:hypothetical protein
VPPSCPYGGVCDQGDECNSDTPPCRGCP